MVGTSEPPINRFLLHGQWNDQPPCHTRIQPFCWSLSAPLRPHANASGANKQHSLELHAVPHLTTRRTGPEAYCCQEYDIYLLNQAHFHGASGEGIFIMYGFGWTCGTQKISRFIMICQIHKIVFQGKPLFVDNPVYSISDRWSHYIPSVTAFYRHSGGLHGVNVDIAMAIHVFPVQRLPSCKKWIL